MGNLNKLHLQGKINNLTRKKRHSFCKENSRSDITTKAMKRELFNFPLSTFFKKYICDEYE